VAARLQAVAFDVLETLLNIEPLRARFEDIGQPTQLLHPWFMRFQRDAMALTLAGDFAAFDPVARQALRTETRHTVTEADIDHVLQGFAELPAFHDAAPALRKLAQADIKIGCLTVGNPENTRRFLDGAGLAEFVDQVITAETAGIWKPAPAIYRTAAEHLQTPLDRMALVAVHAWDCHGAKRAGALAGWCARLEGKPGDVFAPADVTGRDLVEVVDALIAPQRPQAEW
jgi:2-haloacid dehalogenase